MVVTMKCCKVILNIGVFVWQFNFLNCFASLFYIAFVLRDMKLLRQVSVSNKGIGFLGFKGGFLYSGNVIGFLLLFLQRNPFKFSLF